MEAINNKFTVVPAINPVDLNTGANAGDWISLKNYNHCTIVISIGTTTGTAAVTLDKGTAVDGTGSTTLSFSKQYQTGARWNYTGASGTFTVGETVTGAAGASGVVYEDNGDHLLVYTTNATAVVDAETLTGGTSGVTATANGTGVDEDILLPLAVSSDTFTIPAVSNKTYVIEVDAASLGDGYDCMQLDIAKASAGCIGSAVYILSESRFIGTPMLSAIYD